MLQEQADRRFGLQHTRCCGNADIAAAGAEDAVGVVERLDKEAMPWVFTEELFVAASLVSPDEAPASFINGKRECFVTDFFKGTTDAGVVAGVPDAEADNLGFEAELLKEEYKELVMAFEDE